jgi:hypothetical protein
MSSRVKLAGTGSSTCRGMSAVTLSQSISYSMLYSHATELKPAGWAVQVPSGLCVLPGAAPCLEQQDCVVHVTVDAAMMLLACRDPNSRSRSL